MHAFALICNFHYNEEIISIAFECEVSLTYTCAKFIDKKSGEILFIINKNYRMYIIHHGTQLLHELLMLLTCVFGLAYLYTCPSCFRCPCNKTDMFFNADFFCITNQTWKVMKISWGVGLFICINLFSLDIVKFHLSVLTLLIYLYKLHFKILTICDVVTSNALCQKFQF